MHSNKRFRKILNSFSRLKESLKLVSLTLLIGLQLALLIVYVYSLYRGEIKAVEGIRDTLSYQGKIVNADGVPLPDQKYNMIFKIYDAPREVGQGNTGTLLWTEVWDGTINGYDGSVNLPNQVNAAQADVKDGVFNVELNSLCRNWVGTACATNGGVTFKDDSVYLQVELDYDPIDGNYEEVFLPRKRFTATPYAMNSDKLDGRESAEFLLKEGDSMVGELTAPKIIDSSLVGYYKFDNNSVANASGANGFNGVLQNGATIANDVLVLAGATGENFNLNTLNSALNVEAGSVAMWVNRSFEDDTTANKFLFSIKTDSNNLIDGYYDAVSDQWIFEYIAGATVKQIVVPADDININTWTQIAMTWDITADLTVYLNGEIFGTAVTDLGTWAGSVSGTSIGSDGISNAGNFIGKLDEVKIFNRLLTADEIRKNYEANIKNEIQANRLSALEINFQLFEKDQSEGGFLKWDKALNRFVFSEELYAPNALPYFNNTMGDRDYTYLADTNKLLAYDFHESEGTLINDLTGNGHGAVLNGDASWTNLGYIGYGLKFDDLEDYVTFNDPVLNSATGTIELWAKFNGLDKDQDNYLFNLTSGAGQDLSVYRHYVDVTNPAQIYLKIGDSGATDSGQAITDNNWHHYVLSWDNGYYNFYIDSILVVNRGTGFTFDPSGFNAFYLGAASDTYGSLDGILDSFAIYDDVLTESEIINHYNAAFFNLSVINNLSDGVINTTLSNLIKLPITLNEKNRIDPAMASPSNLLLALPFSEGKGNATEVMGAGIQANINGSKWVNDGVYAYGLDFDGVDDFVSMPESAGYTFNLDSGTNYAFEFWFKGYEDGTGDYDNPGKVLLSKKDSASGNNGWEFYINEYDQLGIYLSDGTNTFNPTPAGPDISNGSWHHIAINIDRTSEAKTITQIIDAFSSDTFDFSSVGLGSLENGVPLTIGSNTEGNYVRGTLDSLLIYQNRLLTTYDIFSRITNSPDYFVTVNNNTLPGFAPLSSINQGSSGNSGIFWQNNTTNSEYPLLISNNTAESDVYKLLTFGSGLMTTWSEFGNLKWDNANTKFVLSNNLEIQGDLESKYIKTSGENTSDNEALAFDIVRKTVTTDDVTNSYADLSWSKATTKKVADLHAVCVDESDSYDMVSADDWNTATNFDLGLQYDGSNIRVIKQNGTWEEGDIITVFISYEK